MRSLIDVRPAFRTVAENVPQPATACIKEVMSTLVCKRSARLFVAARAVKLWLVHESIWNRKVAVVSRRNRMRAAEAPTTSDIEPGSSSPHQAHSAQEDRHP